MTGPETFIGQVRSIDLDKMVVHLEVAGRPGHLRASFGPSLERSVRRSLGEPVLVRGYSGRGADFWIDELMREAGPINRPVTTARWDLLPSSADAERVGPGLSHGEIVELLEPGTDAWRRGLSAS